MACCSAWGGEELGHVDAVDAYLAGGDLDERLVLALLVTSEVGPADRRRGELGLPPALRVAGVNVAM